MGPIKQFFQGILNKSSVKNFSRLDEQSLIFRYVDELKVQNRFCVDIAASDGVTMSNTYALFKEGWEGLAVEYDAELFSKLVECALKK